MNAEQVFKPVSGIVSRSQRGISLVLVLFVSCSSISAQEPDEAQHTARELFPDNAWTVLVGVQAGSRSMGGEDFDGNLVLRGHGDQAGTDDETLVPRIEPAVLYGLAVDARSGSWGVAIGYAQAHHDWSWKGQAMAPARVLSRIAHLDVRAHVLAARRIQPFVQMGFLYSGIKVEDARTDIASNVSSAVTFKGWGVHGGSGVSVYPARKLKLTVGIRWSYGLYDRASGRTMDRSLLCAGLDVFLSVSTRVGALSLER